MILLEIVKNCRYLTTVSRFVSESMRSSSIWTKAAWWSRQRDRYSSSRSMWPWNNNGIAIYNTHI